MRRFSSLELSIALSSAVLAWFLLRSAACWHWFVVPLWACGVILGLDVVRWLRREVHLLDPGGILAAILFLRFYWAYLYKVASGFWLRYPEPPPDWRPWVGYLSVMYLVGLSLYRWVSRRAEIARRPARGPSITWHLTARTFFPVLLPVLAMSLSAQAAIYLKYEGISGFIEAYERRELAEIGWLTVLGEQFPILAIAGWAVHVQSRGRKPSWGAIGVVLLIFFILQLGFGGLRGSRTNTIWACIWAVGIVHLWVRPVPRRLVLASIPVAIIFLYVWGFYKAAGREGLRAALVPSRWGEMAQATGRTLEVAWIPGGTEALLVYRLTGPATDYEYSVGRTYLATLAKLVPRPLWAERPPSVAFEGTEALYGKGSYSESFRSSLVYGLMGEGMLNFGIYLAPLTYAILGYAVGRVRRWFTAWSADDARWLLAPFLTNFCVQLQGGDSGNVLFFTIKSAALPAFVIWLAARRVQKAPARKGSGLNPSFHTASASPIAWSKQRAWPRSLRRASVPRFDTD